MHPFRVLQKIIVDAGGVLLEERYDSASFGSCWAIYRRDAKTVRLLWDGKDRWGILQIHEPPNSWTDIGPFVNERDLHESSRDQSKLETFRRFVERALAE